MTFIRVPKGEFVRHGETPNAVDQRVELTREFWLSDREVAVGLFRQFVESVGAAGSEYRKMCPADESPEDWKWDGEDIKISPAASHPVQQVDWNDAMSKLNLGVGHISRDAVASGFCPGNRVLAHVG